MNILYYSVHQILEDDEVRLFQQLGHNVVCLGCNGPHGAAQNFRPAIEFSAAEHGLYDQFRRMGGKFSFGGGVSSFIIPEEFMRLIDITIVMHDPLFIDHFWNVICCKPVIWRTIGQGVDSVDHVLRRYREAGLLVVRYSPIESEVPDTLGQDAVIRFGKSEKVYGDWTGDRAQIITFAHAYKQRYASDYEDYQRIIEGLPAVLGGGSNEGIVNAIGSVSWQEQLEWLRSSSVYLYASGLYIPYTLNFIEAWLTGIPMVVYAPLERRGRYLEIDRLIEDNVNGFVCRDIEETRYRLAQLLDDRTLRERIGSAGRAAAIDLFGDGTIGRQWSTFLSNVVSFPSAVSINKREDVKTVKSPSRRVFDAISLLKPYDVDVGKIRIGNERDGGYVLADNFTSHLDVISFGVGPDVTFELEMAERGHRVFMHDHTVEGPPQHHPRFQFQKVGVAGTREAGPGLQTLPECLAAAGTLSDRLLLKMDIEGWEWDVFSSVPDTVLECFDQIVMEVHWLENLGDPAFHSKFYNSMTKINKQFTLFHVHANNCAGVSFVHGFAVVSVLELSFVRSSAVRRRSSKTVYPSPLNKSNHPNFPDHALLFYPFMPAAVEPERFDEVVTRIDLQQRFPF